MAQILLVEDEVLLRKSLARFLVSKGYECTATGTAEEGIEILKQTSLDLAVVDLQLPGISGFEIIKAIRDFQPDAATIVITAYGTMATVVEAMRAGAADFLRKPVDTDELAVAIERSLANKRMKRTIDYFQAKEIEKTDENRLVSESARMNEVIGVVDRLVSMALPQASDYPPVLLLGETGSGKDMMARHLHYKSKFASSPFIEVNCSNMPQGLEEAELFGYERGAFTGADRPKRGLVEMAMGGTLFLNEIQNLSYDTQGKLLQLIEQKRFRRVGGLSDIEADARVIAASNVELEGSAAFRQDLYHRLNNFRLDIPPLRERREDIIPLAEMFVERFAAKYHTEKRLSNQAKNLLLSYDWPGNIRELQNLTERVSFLARSPVIAAEDLGIKLPVEKKEADNGATGGPDLLDRDNIVLHDIEKKIIKQALESTGGNVSKASRMLKIGREALRYRIKKYGLDES